MSVINVLMQLRKVCNHPNLFDPRPIVSPFQTEEISYTTASIVLRALDKDPLEVTPLCILFNFYVCFIASYLSFDAVSHVILAALLYLHR